MSLAYWISAYNRKRKWKLFLDHLAPTSSSTILDVGFTDEEFSKIDNFLEKNYVFPENITALGIESPKRFSHQYPMVKVVQYDGKTFPFEYKSFDICWSNAVLEHVGDRDRQILFLSELNRVSLRCFITTPNRFFPVEVHTRIPFLHWLPKRKFDFFLRLLGKSWACGDFMRLLSLKELEDLLREAGIKEYKIIKNKLGPFTLDFVVIF